MLLLILVLVGCDTVSLCCLNIRNQIRWGERKGKISALLGFWNEDFLSATSLQCHLIHRIRAES